MDQRQYAMLTEVLGRWKAEIIENLLRAQEIDVVLMEESVAASTQQPSFTPVKIYVPKESLKRAHNLLEAFNEAEDNTKGELNMANKKKIKEQELERQAEQTQKTIRFIALGVIALLVLASIWYFLPKKGQQNQNQATLDYGSDATACQPFADTPVASQYSEPPLKIDTGKQYFATVKMAKGGEFVIQLYPDKAPETVNSFVFLSCKGYFNGVTFHRVLEGFMAQGGDPTGTGQGGPGYQFKYEGSDLKFDKAGVVAMANTGPQTPTNGSQFFITFGPAPQLDGGYTIFGQVVSGMDVVNGITRRDPQQNPTFPGDAMDTVTISEK